MLTHTIEKHRVYLFAPNFIAGLGKVNSAYLPHPVANIWAYVSTDPIIKENFELGFLNYAREKFDDILSKLSNPAICGFSNYIWNEKYNLALASLIKNKYPNCIIVFGGPNVPNVSNDYQSWRKENPAVDATIRYEGELSFKALLLDYLNGNVKQDYVSPRMENLDFPSPYLTGLFDDIVKTPGITWAMTLETNRGCPFACTFCDWGSLTYSKIKKFPLDRVLDEISWAGKNKIEFMHLADANFGVFPDRDSKIISHLIETKNTYGFPKAIQINWYKNSNKVILSLVEELAKNNLNRGLTLSVQSMNPDTLKAIKRDNMKVNDLSELFLECNKRNIGFYTELILGLPLETLETWKSGHFKLLEMGQHGCIFVFPCELLKNSELGINTELYGVKSLTINDYWTCDKTGISEQQHVVLETNTMSVDDMIEATMFSWMLVTFHHHGWIEIYSRYLNVIKGMTYESIYKNFESWIKQHQFFKDQYNKTRKSVEDFYYKGQSIEYYAIWNTVRMLFCDIDFAHHHLSEWFISICPDEPRIIEYQKLYLADPVNPGDQILVEPDNLLNVILGNEAYKNRPVNCVFHHEGSWANFEEFLDLVILRRKESFGKNKILVADV